MASAVCTSSNVTAIAAASSAVSKKSSFLSGKALRASPALPPVNAGKRALSVSAAAARERPLWFAGSTPPAWLDGSLPGHFGSDPLGLGEDYSRSVHVHCRCKQFNCPPNAMTSTCWSGWMRRRLSSRFVRAATTEDIEAEKQLIEEDAVERMEKTLETVKSNFNTIRTGRASPSLLDRIEVECYGSLVALNSVAQVSTPDGSSILIQPFDRSTLSSIERAISKSDVGLNPSNDGSVIRLFIPPLTTERRKDLLKQVSKLSEEGKVAIRNIRRDAIKSYDKLQKEKKISAANVKDLSNSMQKITDDYVKKVEELFKQKEKELLTI